MDRSSVLRVPSKKTRDSEGRGKRTRGAEPRKRSPVGEGRRWPESFDERHHLRARPAAGKERPARARDARRSTPQRRTSATFSREATRTSQRKRRRRGEFHSRRRRIWERWWGIPQQSIVEIGLSGSCDLRAARQTWSARLPRGSGLHLLTAKEHQMFTVYKQRCLASRLPCRGSTHCFQSLKK